MSKPKPPPIYISGKWVITSEDPEWERRLTEAGIILTIQTTGTADDCHP